jgi:hypothetical protein
MSAWQVALVREQGVEFAVVCVRDGVVDAPGERDKIAGWWTMHLARPVVLMGAQRHRTYGRRDIVAFLSRVLPSRLPWRHMNVAV